MVEYKAQSLKRGNSPSKSLVSASWGSSPPKAASAPVSSIIAQVSAPVPCMAVELGGMGSKGGVLAQPLKESTIPSLVSSPLPDPSPIKEAAVVDHRDSKNVGADKGVRVEGCSMESSGVDFNKGEGKPSLSGPSTDKVAARGGLGDILSPLLVPRSSKGEDGGVRGLSLCLGRVAGG